MPTTTPQRDGTPTPQREGTPIDIAFTAPIRQDDGPAGWTLVVVPDSGALLGTRRPVRVGGTIDGHPFRATLLPMGDGTHMVPIKAALRKQLGKSGGDQVAVRLDRRH